MKTCIIRGGNSGLGFETAKKLADDGNHVILACRNSEKGETAARQICEDTDNDFVSQEALYYDRSTRVAQSSQLSYDMNNARDLWNESMKLVGLQ